MAHNGKPFRKLSTAAAILAVSMGGSYVTKAAEIENEIRAEKQEERTSEVPTPDEISHYIPNYVKISPTLATSGALRHGAAKELAGKGVGTFIDLRTPMEGTAETENELEATSAKYHNIPVNGAKGITEDEVKQFAKIYEAAEGPVLINCGSGNRVGALWAAYQLSKGTAAEQAFEEGRKMGMRGALERQVKDRFCQNC